MLVIREKARTLSSKTRVREVVTELASSKYLRNCTHADSLSS